MLPAGSPLSAWLTWIETLSPNEIELGLERVQSVLDRLELRLPQHVITVGGTNGKGSSVAMTGALLRAAGYTVGTYTSPHIVNYNERIVVGASPVSNERIVAAFETIESVRNDVPLTYFEYGTLAAFVVFSTADLDVWLLEVGPTAALITNVAMDHCAWLGEDIETIAVEKAGIMRSGIPVVYGDPDVPNAIRHHADEVGARLLLRDRDYSLDGIPQPGLSGAFQVGNAAAVIALLKAAGLEDATTDELIARPAA